MGDRWILDMKCAYCRILNRELWYAPTSNADFFKCFACHRLNFIAPSQKAKKLEAVKSSEIFNGFMQATNVGWSAKEIERIKEDCRLRLKEIRKIQGK